MECPKCHSDNLEKARFCSSCAAPLTPSEEIPSFHTRALQTPAKDLITGRRLILVDLKPRKPESDWLRCEGDIVYIIQQ